MYKFTNGIVVYDIETRDKYIKAGLTLVKEEPVVKEEKEEKQVDKKEVYSDPKRNEFGKPKKRTGRFNKGN